MPDYEMMEKKQHGTPGFPMQYSSADPYEHPYDFVMHWHKGYEIDRIQEGRMDITIEEKHYSCESGDLIFIPAGALHSAVSDQCSHECIVFEMEPFTNGYDECASLYRDILSGKFEIGPVIIGDSELRGIVDRLMYVLKNEKPGYKEMSVGLLRYMFGLIYTKGYYIVHEEETVGNSPQIKKLKKVLIYIENHFTETIVLEDLAAQVDMSPQYFCSFFKKHTKQKPMEFVNNKRLIFARKELLATNEPITYIAFSAGFNDVSYFIRLFRKVFGESPGNLRRKLRVKEAD